MTDFLKSDLEKILKQLGQDLLETIDREKHRNLSLGKAPWEDSVLSVGQAFALIVESRDSTHFGRSKKVAFCANKMGCFLHLSRQQLIELKLVSFMRDIGNVSIPDCILFKKGLLDDREFNTVKIHPLVSANLAGQLPFIGEDVILAIRHHHEKYDGTGYPDSLKGEQIPIYSRIINICDTMVSMLTKQHYREKFAFLEVMDEIKKHSGRQFDSKISDKIDEIFPLEPSIF